MKGFLSTDIHEMGDAHNDSGIELAKALCEQTNWPLKPVSVVCVCVCIFIGFDYIPYSVAVHQPTLPQLSI